MNKEEYEKSLKEAIHFITFEKADGTERVLKGTRDMRFVPEDQQPKNNGDVAYESETVVRVFDLSINEWRSFNIDRVKAFTEM